MKVYTEVVYTWDDTKNELVEESSKSFDYEGEVTQCIRIGGSLGAAISNVKRTVVTPAQKAAQQAAQKATMEKFKKRLERMKISFGKPKILEQAQKAAAGGATQLKKNVAGGATQLKKNVAGGSAQLKKNVHSATTTARSNVHGVTTAARTGVHTGVDQARTLAHKGADVLKAGWDKLRDKPKEQTGGGGTGASRVAMGSGSETSEKSGKFGSKAQLGKGKRKKSNTGKDKLKVRRTGPQ
jgi:hypothetical protein